MKKIVFPAAFAAAAGLAAVIAAVIYRKKTH